MLSKFKDPPEELETMLNRSALWAITYGDLMSYLAIFFLLLFVFSFLMNSEYKSSLTSIQRIFGADIPKENLLALNSAENEQLAADKLQQLFKSNNMGKYAQIEITQKQVKIMLDSPVLFETGAENLKSSSVPVLKELALILKTLPNNNIVVEGHTDNVPFKEGSGKSNWELSSARAFSVVKFFIEKENINPKRLAAIGYGEFKPLFPNDSNLHKAKNRRIEINIVRTD